MKTKHIIYALLFLIVLSVQRCQCKKDDPIPAPVPQPIPCDTCLPAITTSGKNTFGCRVNGIVWLPLGGGFNPGQWVEYFDQHLIVHGYNDDKGQWINLDVYPIIDTGRYVFYTPILKVQWADYLNAKTNIDYYADTIYKGYINVLRFDSVKGLMSGTFEFDVYDKYHKHNNDTIHITDGRFDLHL